MVALDIVMPDIDGLKVAKTIREENFKIPILILSSQIDTEYLLESVKLHLIDYILKPMSFVDLQKVLQKALKQLQEYNLLEFVIDENNTYDFSKKQLISKNDTKLSKKELLLLEIFCKNIGKLLHTDFLEYEIFEDTLKENSLKQLIYSLRKKLNTQRIHNIKNMGYLFQ